MATLHSFQKHVRRHARIAFHQEELRQLFDVYSRRVAAGEWRDYAIDHYDDRAVFSIFRHTADRPVYVIEKVKSKGAARATFRLAAGSRRLSQGHSVREIIATLKRRPRLIRTAS